MKYTENLGLLLYDTNDKFRIVSDDVNLNNNFKLIDEHIGEIGEKVGYIVREGTQLKLYSDSSLKKLLQIINLPIYENNVDDDENNNVDNYDHTILETALQGITGVPVTSITTGSNNRLPTSKAVVDYVENKLEDIPTNTEFESVKTDVDKLNAFSSMSIINQPVDVNARTGYAIDFHIDVKNATSYQWQYRVADNENANWYNSTANGNKTDTLSLTVSSNNIKNVYRCKVIGGSDVNTIYTNECMIVIDESLPEKQPTNEIDVSNLEEDINKLIDAKTDGHSHSNKSILDGITSGKITEWNNKSTFDGNYNSLKNKPTIPTVPTSQIDANTSARHVHNNKNYLDIIDNKFINKLDKSVSYEELSPMFLEQFGVSFYVNAFVHDLFDKEIDSLPFDFVKQDQNYTLSMTSSYGDIVDEIYMLFYCAVFKGILFQINDIDESIIFKQYKVIPYYDEDNSIDIFNSTFVFLGVSKGVVNMLGMDNLNQLSVSVTSGIGTIYELKLSNEKIIISNGGDNYTINDLKKAFFKVGDSIVTTVPFNKFNINDEQQPTFNDVLMSAIDHVDENNVYLNVKSLYDTDKGLGVFTGYESEDELPMTLTWENSKYKWMLSEDDTWKRIPKHVVLEYGEDEESIYKKVDPSNDDNSSFNRMIMLAGLYGVKIDLIDMEDSQFATMDSLEFDENEIPYLIWINSNYKYKLNLFGLWQKEPINNIENEVNKIKGDLSDLKESVDMLLGVDALIGEGV